MEPIKSAQKFSIAERIHRLHVLMNLADSPEDQDAMVAREKQRSAEEATKSETELEWRNIEPTRGCIWENFGNYVLHAD
jgi:hypothetical protein